MDSGFKDNEEELQEIKELRDTVSDTRLQADAARRRREAAEKDVQRSVSARDRPMPPRRLDPKEASALRLLNAEKQRVTLLTQQLQEHEARACRSRGLREDTLRDARHKEALLGEDADRMNVLCAQLRRSLAEARSRRLAADKDLEQLRSRTRVSACRESGQRKQEQMLDEFVSRLDVAAALGPPGRKAGK
ncbi:hypothetical protein Z043_112812 [Scleropages formosus]|uniref:Uncharacterized protein n=1 Tax=Scleropages formosus TaxID=113540 RepID=A0A0N8JZ69_SCLFO|nr:hypothetical protein Z043_112812 [Scleropages formosus]